LANFHVTSQIQQYASLTVDPQPSEDGKRFELASTLLPHFINSAEWNLASTSKHHELNFLLYVPHTTMRPLKVLTPSSSESLTNGFLVPQWGGVVVYNPPVRNDTNGKVLLRKEELRPVMETFLEQMRGLVGIDAVWRSTPFHARIEKVCVRMRSR
jgi:phosphatidylinositol glycan class S